MNKFRPGPITGLSSPLFINLERPRSHLNNCAFNFQLVIRHFVIKCHYIRCHLGSSLISPQFDLVTYRETGLIIPARENLNCSILAKITPKPPMFCAYHACFTLRNVQAITEILNQCSIIQSNALFYFFLCC